MKRKTLLFLFLLITTITIAQEETPVANAGVDEATCGVLTYSLSAIASVSDGVWSYVSGPDSTPLFSNNTSPTSAITVDKYGTYVFRWTETNGTQTSSDEVTIDFNEDPSGAIAATDQNFCGTLTATLEGVAHTYQAGSDHSGSTAQWVYISGPDAAPVFTDPTSPISDFTVTKYGSYILSWTETNGSCIEEYHVIINFNEIPIGISTPEAQTVCSGEEITNIVLTTSNGMDAGTTYAWTRAYQSYVKGLANSGSGDIIGTPYNVDDAEHMVTYTILPSSSDGCTGDAFTANVTVNPRPAIEVQLEADYVVCNESDISFRIMDPKYSVSSDWRYNLTVDYEAFLTGLNIGGEYSASDINLNDHLVNFDNGGQLAKYKFTPRYTPVGGGAVCENGKDTVLYLWVNPTPKINVSASDNILCNGETSTLTVTNPNNQIFGNWIYDIDVTSSPDISGSIGNQSGITTTNIVQTLTTSDTAVNRAHYHFTPRIRPANGGADCYAGENTSIEIWVNPTPHVYDPPDQAIDNNEYTTAVTFTTNNSGGLVIYSWTNDTPSIGLAGSGTGNIPSFAAVNTGGSAKTATITVTPSFLNAGRTCIGPSEQFQITVNSTAPAANAGSDQNICGTLLTNLEGNDPITGSGTWSQLSDFGTMVFGDINVHNTSAATTTYGTYVLRWTITSNDKVSYDDVTVIFMEDPKGASAGADQELCESLTTTLEGISHSYQSLSGHSESTMHWSYISGPDSSPVFSSETSPTSTVSINTFGTYAFQWIETNGTCYRVDTVTISFNNNPTLDPIPDQEICSGDSVVLTAYGGDIISWDQGIVNGSSFVPLITTEYHVTATNDSECSSYDTVSVIVNPLPVANAGPNQEVCFGESVILEATGGNQYSWDHGVTNGIPIIPISTIEYHVIVRDDNGCLNQDQVLVSVKPIPQTPTITFNSDSLLSNRDFGNQWYVDGNLLANAEDSFFVPTITGTYYTIINEDGCESEKSNNIFIQTTDIKQHEDRKLTIYPNPTLDLIQIETENIGRYILEIATSTGQLLLQQVVSDPIYSVNLAPYMNGLYFITIRTDDYKAIRKVVKL